MAAEASAMRHEQRIAQEKEAAEQAKALVKAQEEIAAATKKVADEYADDQTRLANLTSTIEENLAQAQRMRDAINDGAFAQKLANIEHQRQIEILNAGKTATGEELQNLIARINLTAELARQTAAINTALPGGQAQGPAAREREFDG